MKVHDSILGKLGELVRRDGIDWVPSRVLMLYEAWMGCTSADTGELYQRRIVNGVDQGDPAWWDSWGARGIRRDGLVSIYRYPGGPSAFIQNEIAPRLGADAAFDGLLIIDIETVLPFFDASLRDWLPHVDLWIKSGISVPYEQVARAFWEELIKVIRSRYPRARVTLYGAPFAGVSNAWTDPAKRAALMAAHDRLAWLWARLDVLAPHFYLWTDRLDWFLESRRPLADEVRRVAQASRRMVVPIVMPVHDSASPMSGKGLRVSDWSAVYELCRTAGAASSVVWAQVDDGAMLEQVGWGMRALWWSSSALNSGTVSKG